MKNYLKVILLITLLTTTFCSFSQNYIYNNLLILNTDNQSFKYRLEAKNLENVIRSINPDSLKENEEQKKLRRAAQFDLDCNNSGIGLSLSKPFVAQDLVTDKPWLGVDILADVINIKFGTGKCFIPAKEFIPNREMYVSQASIGLLYPINFLNFGNQYSYVSVFRGHPVLGGDIGLYGFRNTYAYDSKPTERIVYLGVNPGYRLRLPFVSIDFNLNLYVGMKIGSEPDNLRSLGCNPSVTLRLDALKWRYDPDLVTVNGTHSSIQNLQKGETKVVDSQFDYNSGTITNKIETEYTYDVSVKQMNFGIQDIKEHIGIGPKFSFMNMKRTPYVPQSYLFGIVAEGRGSMADLGFTLEGGKIGHGGKLETKSENDGTFRRKLVKTYKDGMGTVNTVNLYMHIGLDVSPVFLGLMGYSMDKGNATSFFTVTAGFITGAHVAFGQSFLDPSDQTFYTNQVANNQKGTKEKFLDPSKVGPGFLGGYYFSFQVGAMAVKITNYRYYGAPFASNTLISLAYRIPLDSRWRYLGIKTFFE